MAKRKKAETKSAETLAVEEIEVKWRAGYRRSHLADARTVYAEIKELEQQHGEYTAALVLERATDEDSAMHVLFEWNDAKAAHEHRLSQARTITRSIIVFRPDKPEIPPGPAFAVDTSKWKKDDGYKPYRSIENIMQDEEARAELLQRALVELISYRRRYRYLQELAIVFRAVDEAIDNIDVE